jgi:hypothetical protein
MAVLSGGREGPVIPEDPALLRARKRAKELRDFYGHLITYVVVCTLLVVIDLIDTSPADTEYLGMTWAYWPILGWGTFVLLHAAATFFGRGRWEERKAEELYEKEKQRELISH